MLNSLELDIIDALKDDYYGIWEFDWRLNYLGFDQDRAARIKLLSELVAKDCVDIYYGRLADRSVEPLSKDEALNSINKLANWKPRTDVNASTLFLATKTDNADCR